MVFAQLQFLLDPAFHSSDTSALIDGALQWLAGGAGPISIVLAGFDTTTANLIQASLTELSFATSTFSESTFSEAHVVIVPSDVSLENSSLADEIVAFLADGGGLAVFHKHVENAVLPLPINAFLIEFGLAFTVCVLKDASRTPIPVRTSFEAVQDSSFEPLTERFKALLLSDDIDTAVLDDLVTTLRYYIMVCNDEYSDQLVEIADAAWGFLHRTEYLTNEGFCPETEQGIIAVLLQELYANLPVTKSPPVPDLAVFPGETGKVSLRDVTLKLTLKPDIWVSTGLWLPAGVAAQVITERPLENVCVQIGAHCESLLVQPGPWRRWPSVVTEYELSKRVTDVGTVFGGIVYAILSAPAPPSLNVKLTFNQFTMHPRFLVEPKPAWKASKNTEVPWAEIDLGNIIFTLPTAQLRKIKHFERLKKKYDDMITHLTSFMNYRLEHPYRIVFDIQLPDDGPRFAYPSVLLLRDMDGVLMDLDTPNMNLFKALSVIAIASIREDRFDVQIETALASAAAAVVFKALFPKFDPFNFSGLTLPPLFAELWNIHTSFSKALIPSLLEVFQDPDYSSGPNPLDPWVAFVTELCRLGYRNFVNFLGSTRPIHAEMPAEILAMQGYP
jgi:hypothetical protein